MRRRTFSLPFHIPPLYCLYVAVFIDMVALAIVLPLLPYYAISLGADAVVYGYLGSVYGVMQLIGSPIMGRLSDKHGRVPILLISFIGSAFSYFILSISSSLWLLFLSRIPVGLVKQTLSVSYAYVSDSTSPESRSRHLGYIGTTIGLAWIVGPALGGVISRVSITFPAILASLLFLFDFFFVLLFLPEAKNKLIIIEEQEQDPELGNNLSETKNSKNINNLITANEGFLGIKKIISDFGSVFKNPSTSFLLLILFLSSLAYTVYRSNFSFITSQQFNLDAEYNGYILSYAGVISVFIQGFGVGFMTSRISETYLINIMEIGMAVSLIMCSLLNNIYSFLFFLIPLLGTWGILRTSLLAVITKHAKEGSTGVVIGVADSAENLCRVLSPGVGGLLMEYFGVEWLGVGAGAALGLFGVFVMLASARYLRQPKLKKDGPYVN